MDITFLVGNGFDLSLGHKTSYKDFYEYYLQQPNNPGHEDAISRLKASINEDRKKGYKDWSDFEIGLGISSKSFSLDEVNEYVDACSDAIQYMNDYLSNLPRKNTIDAMSEKQWDIARKNLCNFFLDARGEDKALFSRLRHDEQDHGLESRFHFISFNYTNFLDEYIAKMAQKPLETWKHSSGERKHILDSDVFHVHGQLNDFPIVGVSDARQILNQSLLKSSYLRQTLIKPNGIAEIRSTRYSEAKATIDKSRIICLLGLSLGDSDEHWWYYVNKWLKNDQNRHLFIFEHTDNPPNNTVIADYFQKRRNVAYRLLKQSDFSDEEKESLLSRIYVVFNTKKVLVFPKKVNSINLH